MNYTPKQLQIMNFIRDYRAANRTSPTLEEIGTSLGCSDDTCSVTRMRWGGLDPGVKVRQGNPLFPRIKEE